ncbi:MAG: hypothetical protein WCT14_13650 [Treponemataceae bacterium]
MPLSFFVFSGESTFSRSVAHAMGNRPYALRNNSTKNSSMFPFLLTLLSVSAVAFLLKSVIPLASLPAMFAVAGFGSGGIIVAGLLCVCFMMLFRSFAEFARSQMNGLLKKKKAPWVFDSLLPGALFFGLALVVSLLGSLPLIVIFFAILSSASIAFFTVVISHIWDQRRAHARFFPVGLRAHTQNVVVRLSTIILPFAIAASFFLIGDLYIFRSPIADIEISSLAAKMAFNLDEYSVHQEKQRSFLTTRVMDANAKKGYTLFSVGSDGFTFVSDQSVKNMPLPGAELPPAESFLAKTGVWNASSGRSAVLGKSALNYMKILAELAIAFALSLPALRAFSSKRRQLKAASAVADKRIAA